MKLKTIQIWTVILFSVCALRAQTAEQWRMDLSFLAKELPINHKNLFHALKKKKFEKEIKLIESQIPNLSRDRIIVEIARLLALVGDGHTQISLFPESWDSNYQTLNFHRYPLRLKFFEEGIFVTEASPEYQQAIGKKIVRIGNKNVNAIITQVKRLISRDNEQGVKPYLTRYLVVPEVLEALGLGNNLNTITYTLADEAVKKFDLKISSVPQNSTVKWITARNLQNTSIPLADQNPREFYWYKYLRETKSLFVQINACVNKPELSLGDFLGEVLQVADSNEINHLIIDLRRNVGGNAGLMRPFIQKISENNRLNQKGKLFVLIGNVTFSAALWNALDFQNLTKAIFIGEPTGGKPSSYGESKELVLPNSKLTLSFSSEYYDCSGIRKDKRLWLTPNIEVKSSFSDYLQGVDTVLQKVIKTEIK